MIERKLHYCWFGGRPLPLQARLCLASWAYHLPDYEIVRWDEQRFDPASHPFTADAYAAGRFAFVSDYVRMFALSQQGGIYLDVDVEVLSSLDGCLDVDFFIGLEDRQRFATSLIAAVAGHWLPQRMLAYYDQNTFAVERVSELVNVNEVSRLLLEHGFLGTGGYERQGGEQIYPIGCFGAANRKLACADRVYSRHLFAGTWRSTRNKGALSRAWRLLRNLPENLQALLRLAFYRAARRLANR
ncbi:Glycosyltransferase sugar-binding region containing DXD motif-containing protein [Pseudomonas cuatrocienegasensis]|uniref:Glycosyltransferase sugar-binding region containing DXD motif-containing protein n=1 Tax=Pseudomonas cuatrocienegasensis TaxID=543360 RepID=A0ABY1BH08_9PSED|nr:MULTISPECIES: glycosyltransferase [Pseudomonas]OEC32918.1 mannosyltransferase [Pseudomonas sp. 21C1]SEQ84281.1 Glycosyltransferase sugar-binding region containing DXD motif-containing protein [Pseudomonas cuatrocienegasensis]